MGGYDLRGKRVDFKEPEYVPTPDAEIQAIEQRLTLLKRQQRVLEARERFLPFVKFTMPHPEAPNDPERSLYEDAKHHRAIARVLEEVEKGNITKLILTTAPRHGKSQLSTRHFPAWYSGRHPDHNIAIASYSDVMAEDFGADVRSILQSPSFRQVFPNYRLRKGGSAKSRIQTEKGGLLVFVGLGGALTGRGAHCFPAGTLVDTNVGQIRIEDLQNQPTSVKVRTYDGQNGQIVERRIAAFAARKATRLFRITTTSGRMVEATGDHPFLTPRGYVEAAALAPGDHLLCVLRNADDPDGVRGNEAPKTGVHGVLLLECLLGALRKRPTIRLTQMLRMWVCGATRREERVARQHILLGRLSNRPSGARKSQATCGLAETSLRRVLGRIFGRSCARKLPREEGQSTGAVLQPGVQEPRPLAGDVRKEEPQLQARFGRAAADSRRPGVSRHETSYTGEGWTLLHALPKRRDAACSSHRIGPKGQPMGQSRDAMQFVPFGTSWARAVEECCEEDEVRSVDEVPVDHSGVKVFDIEVEGTHNFFANGICVSNCLLIDDPVKGAEEARSQALRDQAWDWFNRVAMTRLMGNKLVVITLTRWHEDDIVGRLTDPTNPHYNAIEAEKWRIINFPAIAEDDDPLGRQPGEPLWPERYDLDFLRGQQRRDPLGFAALYQQRPTVEDGILFRRETIQYYTPEQLPKDLRIYGASDHAVGTDRAKHDATVLLSAGVDRQGNIYLLDCFWERAPTDRVVEAMLEMARLRRPLVWWAERGHISKSIGPFLKKRMLETNTFFSVVENTPVANKEQRAQSIAARIAMGMVYFPKHATWTQKAIDELLKFPNGRNDDFCDTIAHLGLGLQSIIKAAPSKQQSQPPKYGTLAWVKHASKQREREERRAYAGGW